MFDWQVASSTLRWLGYEVSWPWIPWACLVLPQCIFVSVTAGEGAVVCVLVWFLLLGWNTLTKSNWRAKRVYLASTPMSQSILEGSVGRNLKWGLLALRYTQHTLQPGAHSRGSRAETTEGCCLMVGAGPCSASFRVQLRKWYHPTLAGPS